uniref:LIM and calponin homology domains 1 n=1 Tax=Gasterosteus aculeatus aculeatus TaxID=481459 RepID=A0AAQ4S8U5_GASAC
MASPVADGGDSHQHPAGAAAAAACAFREAREWIEAVTGRCFGDKDFRGGLENGILLCELLSSIKPGLVKKINRLPTPIAGLAAAATPSRTAPPTGRRRTCARTTCWRGERRSASRGPPCPSTSTCPTGATRAATCRRRSARGRPIKRRARARAGAPPPRL